MIFSSVFVKSWPAILSKRQFWSFNNLLLKWLTVCKVLNQIAYQVPLENQLDQGKQLQLTTAVTTALIISVKSKFTQTLSSYLFWL